MKPQDIKDSGIAFQHMGRMKSVTGDKGATINTTDNFSPSGKPDDAGIDMQTAAKIMAKARKAPHNVQDVLYHEFDLKIKHSIEKAVTGDDGTASLIGNCGEFVQIDLDKKDAKVFPSSFEYLSDIAVNGNSVFLMSTMDGKIQAFGKSTGEPGWIQDLKIAKGHPLQHIKSVATDSRNNVYISCSGKDYYDEKHGSITRKDALLMLDGNTGEVMSRKTGPQGFIGKLKADDKGLLATGYNEKNDKYVLKAYDKDLKNVSWKFTAGDMERPNIDGDNPIFTLPDGTLCFVAEGTDQNRMPYNVIYGLDRDTGQEKWNCVFNGNEALGIYFSKDSIGKDGKIYFGARCWDRQAKVYSFDPATGKKELEYASDNSQYISAVTVDNNGTLLFTEGSDNRDAYVMAINKEKDVKLKLKTEDTGLYDPPQVSKDGKMYLVRGNKVRVLDINEFFLSAKEIIDKEKTGSAEPGDVKTIIIRDDHITIGGVKLAIKKR